MRIDRMKSVKLFSGCSGLQTNSYNSSSRYSVRIATVTVLSCVSVRC